MTRRTCIGLILLGSAGQMTWAAEHQYFTTFDVMVPTTSLVALQLQFTRSTATWWPGPVPTRR